MGASMVQINTRVPAEPKEQGDLALARAGYTPAQAVRALWGDAVVHIHEPQAIHQRAVKRTRSLKIRRQLRAIHSPNGKNQPAHAALCERMGISMSTGSSNIPFDELKRTCGDLERSERLRAVMDSEYHHPRRYQCLLDYYALNRAGAEAAELLGFAFSHGIKLLYQADIIKDCFTSFRLPKANRSRREHYPQATQRRQTNSRGAP